MGSDEIAFASLAAVRDLLRSRQISARELVRAQLGRIETVQPRLNAFISILGSVALDQARRADEAAARRELLGPLHGVPVTVKDLFWTRGLRTTSGSKILADFVPDEDATVVRRLRDAGAVILGKTNLHELAYGVTSENPHYGAVRNPWDAERISGGSSGGSAAALAAGIGYASLGTDTGGSIRIPSALCGTVGLKPTYGRVSRYGVTPLAWSLDHVGPMSRSVRDAAIVYEVVAGPDPSDPSSSGRAVEPLSDALEELPDGVRVGLAREYFFSNLHPEVASAVESALKGLEAIGLQVVEVTIPELAHQSSVRNVIGLAEAAAYHRRDIQERPEDFGRGVKDLLQLGLLIPATDYLDAQRARRRLIERFEVAFRQIDLLAAPTTVAPAPLVGASVLDNGEEVRKGLLRLSSPFNTTGFPAISVPCGFTENGLPIGLQLAARPFEEALLLQVAHAYEQSRPWRYRHPE